MLTADVIIPRKDLEINKMLTFSTAHLKESDLELAKSRINPIHTCYENEYGFFIYVPVHGLYAEEDGKEFEAKLIEAIETGYSQEFCHLLRIARKYKCRFINPDRDGEFIDGLPTFDW
jgi:hypothetical protein